MRFIAARQLKILRALESGRKLKLQDLAHKVESSISTVKRDLADLAQHRDCKWQGWRNRHEWSISGR